VTQKQEAETVVIRRYGNRRLYDTRSSAYVNLADLKTLLQSGTRIRVVDAKTEEDVTRRVLTQIVLESADEKGLPLDLLYELARASDRAFRDFLDWYLKSSTEVYRRLQERWKVDAGRRWGDARPALEAWAKLWDPRQVAASLTQLLSPFDRGSSSWPGGATDTADAAPDGSDPGKSADREAAAPRSANEPLEERPTDGEIAELRRRLDELERRLERERDEDGAREPRRR
jgi:polyhydroxyalkanoate synthesis repressor PhaR